MPIDTKTTSFIINAMSRETFNNTVKNENELYIITDETGLATSKKDGLMSAADKEKLDNIAYNATKNKGFELVDQGSITEDVIKITPNFQNRYNELKVVLHIPTTNADESSTEKCRVSLLGEDNKHIFHMPDAFIPNYSVPWYAILNVKVVGNYVESTLWHIKEQWVSGRYAVPPETATYNGCTALSILDNNSIGNISMMIYSPNNGRVFPAGTTYELWGVKV